MEYNTAIKVKIKINRSIPTEYLLNNIIDKDFQAALLPLRIIQSFFLIFQFSIINNFITPERNTSFYIKSVLGYSILLLIHIFRFLFHARHFQDIRSSVVIFFIYFNLLYFCVLAAMMYIDSALKRNNLVELVIKMQKILNSIKIDKKAFYLKHRIQNWLSILSLVSVCVVHWWFSYQDSGFDGLLANFPYSASTLIYDMNIVNAIRTVAMIQNMLVAWTHAMQEYKKDNIETCEEIKNHEMSEKVMFGSYCDIIQSFRLCNKIYEITVTYFAFRTFLSILLSLESVIVTDRSTPDESFFKFSSMRILSIVWNIKNVIVLASLSIACENFYITVKSAESCCALILNDDPVADMRKTCKNVARLNGAVTQKLSACGVFQLDAAFPLRLLGGVVAYTVVLLQFAFL